MRKLLIFTITVAMLFHSLASFCYAQTEIAISAESAVLIDADSGEVLWKKSAYKKMGMASTTKVMTALTVLRISSPDETVTVSKEAVGTEGSSIYLCEGEKMTVEDMLCCLLLASANDAAVALAIHCSGSVENFCEEMNGYAEELGLENTHFTNPHGLYNEEHYTTAYELAVICREAMKNQLLSRIFATYKTTVPFCGEADKRLEVNHNKLIRSYDGAVGIKTGFTKKTGRCLTSAATRDGLTLICVTLNAPDDWRDHTALLDYGYENYYRYTFAKSGEFTCDLPVVGGDSDSVTLTNLSELSMTLPRSHSEPEITVLTNYRLIYAPATQGSVYATVMLSCNGQTVSSPLTADVSVSYRHKKGIAQKISDLFEKD